MPDGIIYIARNNSNPENHYKIGKSYRIDPVHRMRELTSETTNYEDEFISLGHVIVNNVDAVSYTHLTLPTTSSV